MVVHMQVDRNILRKMAETGFVAVEQGYVQDARKIVESLRAVRPESPVPYVIESALELRCNNPGKAVDLLKKEAIPRAQDDAQIEAILGFTLAKAGLNHESETVLKRVLQKKDSQAIAVAEGLLNMKTAKIA